MDISKTGAGGGPYTSALRVMESGLRERYDFATITYDPALGRNISVTRIRDLTRQLRQLQPDIVHFAGLQLSGFHVAVACALAGLRNTIVTVHGFSGDAIFLSPAKRLLMTGLIEPLTLILAREVCCVSQYVAARRMVQLFARKRARVVYNLPPAPYGGDDTETIRAELGLNPHDIAVVTVGRIIRDKGYHILDQAIIKFGDDPNVKFIVVGEGDYLPEMRATLAQQEVSGQVRFLGYRADVQRILHACDIFVLPTLHETLSIALLEASVEGLALIASNTGGIPEIVVDGYNGLLVAPGDVQALSDAIDRLARDQTFLSQCRTHARDRVTTTFAPESIQCQIDRLYTQMLATSSRRPIASREADQANTTDCESP
jgi:glycosyltransferase involved in cell wall biosynthesis